MQHTPIEKTALDCAACPVMVRCDAHITGGDWQHNRGVRPCLPIIDADAANKALELVTMLKRKVPA